MLKHYLFVSGLILLAGFNSHIQAHPTGETGHTSMHKEHDSKLHQHQKPGAAVQFAHNYDGVSDMGEVESVNLLFSHGYQAGIMSVQIEAQEGLKINNNSSPYIFALDQPDSPEIALELRAEAEGKYYLSIFATVDDPSGNPMSRVFALAFKVGNWAEIEKSNLRPVDMALEKTGDTGAVILMPAEETISN